MHQKPTMPLIPLETFRNFFCLDFKEAFQNSLTKIAPHKSKELVGAIFEDLGLNDQKVLWDRLSPQDSTHIGIVAAQDGSFFMHVYAQDGNIEHHSLISGFCNTLHIDGEDRPSIEIHSLLSAHEVQSDNDRMISTSVCTCRSYINQNYETALIVPETSEQFFAYLCYMHHVLSTCLAGDRIDLDMNSIWLPESSFEVSQENFSDLLGAQSIEEVVAWYNDFKCAMSEMLEKIDADPEAQEYINELPTRILQ